MLVHLFHHLPLVALGAGLYFGRGSATADSMIEGRTIDTGTSPFDSNSACSPSAFVNAYASGQPTLTVKVLGTIEG